MKEIAFNDIECVEIANEKLRLLVSISVGPRVLSLNTQGGDNLFAELPDLTLDCPGAGPYHLYGGHRLWSAPEEPGITYLPDDSPVQARAIDNGVRITQDVESKTTLQKELEIRPIDDRAEVEVKHTITNRGSREQALAPWAITQFKPGGVGILPLSSGDIAGNPTLPDRSIVLWPYTDFHSPQITWGNRYILVRAQMHEGSLKLGLPNPAGWLAYWIDAMLFVKRADFDPKAVYFDLGSSSECYCNPHFLELETLAPIVKLGAGDSVEHVERWQVYEDVAWSDDLKDIFNLLKSG